MRINLLRTRHVTAKLEQKTSITTRLLVLFAVIGLTTLSAALIFRLTLPAPEKK